VKRTKKQVKDYLTVIVTIRNRIATLGRAMNYYRNHSPVKVIFLDSTAGDPLNLSGEMIGSTNEYRHVRGKSYVEKLHDCLKTIDTKYTIIVCDDDFLCFSGIPYSLQYLEENPDVVAVSGQEVAFVEPETTVCGDGLICYETIEYLVDFMKPEINATSPKERIKQAWDYFDGGYVHSIMSTKMQIDIQEFHMQNPDINAMGFYDKTLVYYLAAKGKLETLPTFLLARSQEFCSPSFITATDAEDTIGDWRPSLKFKDDFLKCDTTCLEELAGVDRSFIEEAHKSLCGGKVKEDFFKKILKELAIINSHETKINNYNVMPRFGPGANFTGDHGWQERFQLTHTPAEKIYPVMEPVNLHEIEKIIFYIEELPLVDREQLGEVLLEAHQRLERRAKEEENNAE
jgi:glycosyltransferase domain-containing protein|tara:strand:+ start:49 stop:1251 length:1203 start_codon:yes stop_codon:yes gene_type:complete